MKIYVVEEAKALGQELMEVKALALIIVCSQVEGVK